MKQTFQSKLRSRPPSTITSISSPFFKKFSCTTFIDTPLQFRICKRLMERNRASANFTIPDSVKLSSHPSRNNVCKLVSPFAKAFEIM
ncbi:hypothetical protein BCR33DRAFT_185733 [Rhizoclosmatium globosum]|uniref:Uncharacterized protein n=1 Tax=Rhizoclosmatium globosum TaxID=329046 RepID=A0A1Y2D3D9_9FUNG|nr:hypothetical protein BCR33DRAFT_185733 [Rhizoclosmatium globosum]|eukprot:ORY53065.1 hypothetical protein BCR33DRAFT_185733 [Rhizoclosmatium globosum]